MFKAARKVFKETTWTLFWSSVVVSFGSGFFHGYNKEMVHAPQTAMGLWIREIECRKRNASRSTNGSETELWCKVLSAKEQEKMFDKNPVLNVIWTGIASVYAVGGVVGALAIFPVVQRYGRKRALLLNSIPCMAGSLTLSLAYMAKSYWMLVAGRLISGIGAEICACVSEIYLTEISTVKQRGFFGTLRAVLLLGGQLTAQTMGHPDILGTATGWPILFAFSLIPAVLQLVFLLFCPDTPSYLFLDQKNEHKGKEALKRFRTASVYETELAELEYKQKVDGDANKPVSLLGLWRDPFLRHCLLVSIVLNMGIELLGYTAILIYSTSIFIASGLNLSAAVTATIGTTVLMLMASVLVALLIDRCGRRVLLLIGYTGMLVITSTVTVLAALLEKYVQSDPQSGESSAKQNTPFIWTTYTSASCVYLFLVFYSLGPGEIPQVLASEMFTQGPRAAAMCMSAAFTALAAFVISVVFPFVKSAIGGYAFVIFVVLQVNYVVFTYFKVPETKGKQPEEIVKTLRDEWEKGKGE
ncbi:hypothetical protein RvY_00212 [Ramazzottius varieornatus]|uniref:Major facilitator superfamily (MFS) profile domain-containing protein n=1 Tax=Ramazzottius varieornatus TaxID=947166 RepID=A0A1D1UBZ5_RAMVA|nr:hypothetical protein RvY_00212 [Ramazzottius varieornatus]